jgi:uncharacterized lipoprotein YajG
MKVLVLLSAILLVSCATPHDTQELARQLDAINQALISYANATSTK